MKRPDRLNRLLELIAERHTLEVDELQSELGVSAATIRRDLDHLDEQRMLTRTRGGAVANNVAYDLPIRYKTTRKIGEKQRIAAAAAELVRSGMRIACNGGTTTTEVARALTMRDDLAAEDGTGPTITIATNAVNIASELAVRPQVKLVLTGGVMRTQSYELVGSLVDAVLDQLNFDLAIVGVNGIDPVHGASAADEKEAAVNRLMASRSARVVIVADSSKLGLTAFANICTVEEIDVLITDSGADARIIEEFRQAGIETVVV
ncbi:DeoR/GlpR family DNA-binding transcription regulator [Luethyella okanaganae]|uniref:DeoR/GlpR family DNA-binding transcription regulator n=1 Tax=Luethyella okanaganae TaxID=69372 RepID=A0ABW1VDQ7_9MICO